MGNFVCVIIGLFVAEVILYFFWGVQYPEKHIIECRQHIEWCATKRPGLHEALTKPIQQKGQHLE